MDLKLWMSNLDFFIREKIPLIFLAIPGTHDSMTFSIDESSSVAPDCNKAVRLFLKLGCYAKRIVINWSITQTLSVKEQLNHGIRYFDLRIAKNNFDGKFYYVHSLYGPEVRSKLQEISEFLDENKKEVVVLDFQHFYNLKQFDHISFILMINEIFQYKICPDPCNICDVTLQWMEKNSYQLIVIYRNPLHILDERFWPSHKFPTPWPNTTNINFLLSFLNNGLNQRKPNQGYVSQCVLTPDLRFVLLHFFGSLKNSCAIRCLKALLPWIDHQQAGNLKGINVIISDFVERNDASFCRNVIKLNNSLFCQPLKNELLNFY